MIVRTCILCSRLTLVFLKVVGVSVSPSCRFEGRVCQRLANMALNKLSIDSLELTGKRVLMRLYNIHYMYINLIIT